MKFTQLLVKVILTSFISLLSFYPIALTASNTSDEKPIAVVVVSYNNINWCWKNLQSILTQNYSNYRVIYVDDCSTDGTGDAVEKIIKEFSEEKRVLVIHNKKRAGTALANHYKAIHDHCKNEEIVVCVDGDDWLAHNQVLNVVNETYSANNIWLTHGTLAEYHLDNRNGRTDWSIPIPSEIVQKNAFREFRCATHLKTFYAWLFKKIKDEDFLYEGVFYPVTGDQAMIFPMIEMAAERHAFIPQVLYIYNMTNPLGDSIVSTILQRTCEAHIRSKPPYERLEEADFSVNTIPSLLEE